ncbi:hypothetical protein B0T36_25040 [Nocardia donostiensis]|nr:DUF4192 family protein [Nocardia donostiensis]OQS12447.1 hypothetical protein B0T36_25040 [Nocardia donostiensis]
MSWPVRTASRLPACFAYTRGDGLLAGIALDSALTADPRHLLAALVHTALQAGLPPERIRMLARAGREVADDLGVDMPTAL